MGALKGIRIWQIALLVVLLAVIATGTYLVLAPPNSGNDLGLGEDEQLVAAQIGDLRNEVSTNGSVVFPNTSSERFGSSGTVGDVMVSVGDQVTGGHVLATLDGDSFNALNKSVLEARSELTDAQEALDMALQPATALAIATARSRIAEAAQSVRVAEDSREELLNPTAQIELSEAQNAVESAKTALDIALEDRDIAFNRIDLDTQDARDAFAAAEAEYQEVFVRWLGITPTADDLQKPVDELLAQWNVDLEALFSPDHTQPADLAKGPFSSGPPIDDPETAWSEPTVYAWLNFFPSFIAISCDDSSSSQGPCILGEMEDAWTQLGSTRDALADVERQVARALVAVESAAARAEDALARANEKLAELESEPDPLDIDIADARLTVARESLIAEQEELADLIAPPDAARIELLRAEVAEAAATLQYAQDRVEGATLTAPFDGFVSAVNVESGDVLTDNRVAIEIVDPTEAEVDGIVDEIDVLFVQVGDTATVTMDALPGTPLSGSVSFIDSAPINQQGVVSYPIRVRVDLPSGVSLRAGLSATANIVIEEDLGVLLIPTQAVRGSFIEPFVLVRADSDFQERLVQLGNSDDFWVEVTEGLTEGEQVVMRVAQAASDPFAVFRAGGAFRGPTTTTIVSSSRSVTGGGPVRPPPP